MASQSRENEWLEQLRSRSNEVFPTVISELKNVRKILGSFESSVDMSNASMETISLKRSIDDAVSSTKAVLDTTVNFADYSSSERQILAIRNGLEQNPGNTQPLSQYRSTVLKLLTTCRLRLEECRAKLNLVREEVVKSVAHGANLIGIVVGVTGALGTMLGTRYYFDPPSTVVTWHDTTTSTPTVKDTSIIYNLACVIFSLLAGYVCFRATKMFVCWKGLPTFGHHRKAVYDQLSLVRAVVGNTVQELCKAERSLYDLEDYMKMNVYNMSYTNSNQTITLVEEFQRDMKGVLDNCKKGQ